MTDFRKRMNEMNRRAIEKDFVEQKLEGVKQTLLDNYLTPEARQRLAELKAVRPELATKIETMLAAAAQAGEIKNKIDENSMKTILNQATTNRDFRLIL